MSGHRESRKTGRLIGSTRGRRRPVRGRRKQGDEAPGRRDGGSRRGNGPDRAPARALCRISHRVRSRRVVKVETERYRCVSQANVENTTRSRGFPISHIRSLDPSFFGWERRLFFFLLF